MVPLEIVLDLIKEAMLKRISTTRGFLLDGYPREISQGILFEEEVKKRMRTIVYNIQVATSARIACVAWHGQLSNNASRDSMKDSTILRSV